MNTIPLPIEFEWFSRQIDPQWIPAASSYSARGALRRARCIAKYHLNSGLSLEPTAEARANTLKAIEMFWSLSLKAQNGPFPFAGMNRCMGMAVLPGTRLVLVAVSYDKDPAVDIPSRQKMNRLIEKVNGSTKEWIYDLVRNPTQSELLLLRTLSLRSPLDEEAPQEILSATQWSALGHEERKAWMESNSRVRANWFSQPQNEANPRCSTLSRCADACDCGKSSRCVEIALMAGLCQAGRFKPFEPQDVCIIPFGASLWTVPFTSNEDTPVACFGNGERNRKYVCRSLLVNGTVYFDEWLPCQRHCKIYRNAMLALGAAGGPGTSFLGPRSDTF